VVRISCSSRWPIWCWKFIDKTNHHPLGPVAVLRGPGVRPPKKTQRGILERAGAEISGLFRRGWLQNHGGGLSSSPAAGWTYADLSMFQMVEGLRYSYDLFRNALRRSSAKIPAPYTIGLRRPPSRRRQADTIKAHIIGQRPAAIAFNEDGIFFFSAYKELDI